MSHGHYIQKAPLRKWMPHADGKANPMQWWAIQWLTDKNGKEFRDIYAGPFNTRRELEAALVKYDTRAA